MSNYILFGVSKSEALSVGVEPDEITKEWPTDLDIVKQFATSGFPQDGIIASSKLAPKVGVCFLAQGSDHGPLFEYSNGSVRKVG